jgi:adenylate kinase family enzyme
MTNRRIHITGGPGSGKTTLARQLSARLHLPCYELDEIGYEGGAGAERLPAVRLADVAQIASQPAWVTEGIFLGWTEPLFEAADRIIWLDLPWRIVAWRIFTRHVMAELRGNNRHTGWLKLYRFMQWTHGYYHHEVGIIDVHAEPEVSENRVTTAAYLAKFKDKVVHCQSPADVNLVLASLSTDQSRE